MSKKGASLGLSFASRRNGLASQLSRQCCRQFSTTPSYGVRAIFHETTNPELNAILKHIQEYIILPAYLPKKQRDYVFDPKMQSRLKENPVVIEVEGLEHRFSTINRFKDIMNSKKALTKALSYMETKEEWQNLGTLLAGFKKAGISLGKRNTSKLVRLAGQTGNIYEVIECVKQEDKTGLSLTDYNNVAQTFLFVSDKSVVEGEDALAEKQQALRWTQILLDLLERGSHRGTGHNFAIPIRGLALNARAQVVKAKQEAGADAEQDMALLRDETQLLVSLWAKEGGKPVEEQIHFARSRGVSPPGTEGTDESAKMHLNQSSYARLVAHNARAMQMAKELAGDIAAPLAPVAESLDKHLDSFVRSCTNPTASMAEEYQRIMGKKPTWADAVKSAKA